jgi:hypothetical protein
MGLVQLALDADGLYRADLLPAADERGEAQQLVQAGRELVEDLQAAGDHGLVGPLHLLDLPAGPGEDDTEHRDSYRCGRIHDDRDDLHAAPRISHQSSSGGPER